MKDIQHEAVFLSWYHTSTRPAGFDVLADWWNTNVGYSGQYWTIELRDEVFEPAYKTVINHLDMMKSELDTRSNYNVLGFGHLHSFGNPQYLCYSL